MHPVCGAEQLVAAALVLLRCQPATRACLELYVYQSCAAAVRLTAVLEDSIAAAAARRAETASIQTRRKQLYLSHRSTVLRRRHACVDCKGNCPSLRRRRAFHSKHKHCTQPKRRRRSVTRDAAALQTRRSRRRRRRRSDHNRTVEEKTPRLAPRGQGDSRALHVARQEQPLHQINTGDLWFDVPLRSLFKSVSVDYLL